MTFAELRYVRRAFYRANPEPPIFARFLSNEMGVDATPRVRDAICEDWFSMGHDPVRGARETEWNWRLEDFRAR